MKKTLLSTSLIALAAFGVAGCDSGDADDLAANNEANIEANNEANNLSGDFEDARLTGRIETMYLLNPHLSAFEIDTDVENGIVRLSGSVESDIDRDLAGSLAENVDGVVNVDNELEIDANARQIVRAEADGDSGRRDFGTWVDDTTTTAAVKSRLVGNAHTKGLEIDVDTQGDIVTLSGRVETAEEKDLAEQIARDTGDVADVRNNLVVDPA
jgi:osmotically-inducible protein OsmY